APKRPHAPGYPCSSVKGPYDLVRVIVVRDGTAIVSGDFGRQPVAPGDAVVLGSGVLFGMEPEGHFTFTTIYLDENLALDQFFWQYSVVLHDRLDAEHFAKTIYPEPTQVIHLGRDRARHLALWLDEMVQLSNEGKFHERFYRLQALWFAVADVIMPFVRASPVRLTKLQRARTCMFPMGYRKIVPLGREAIIVRATLRSSLAYPWTLAELADLVQISPRQLARIFAASFGKTPTAYLTMLRVQEMARLLRDTNITVTTAGQRVGWRSRSWANQAFTMHMGMTPSNYRDQQPVVSDSR
ncbi:helix-turn-helix transcriptional regulator, partial [Kocuria carniphila]|uniref:helix-turn-helix transcriptional regulator n=1 Tax=Kocuria carniphila TaxID=262208 RepID=UPI0028E1A472